MSLRYTLKWLTLGCVIAGAFLLVLHAHAYSRDLGQYDNVDRTQREWFNGLKNYLGEVCCYDADGLDAKWDTRDNHYRVEIDGKMTTVPTEALVTSRNEYGIAKVWLTPGTRNIRCFMPGTQS